MPNVIKLGGRENNHLLPVIPSKNDIFERLLKYKKRKINFPLL